MPRSERQIHSDPTGVVTTACLERKRWATREAPAVRMCETQPELREEQAGPFGVAERLVVVKKPGNAGGAKGPWFEESVRSNDGRGDWR